MPFSRPHAVILARRLAEPRRFIHAMAGPRPVGKITLVQQVTSAGRFPTRHASADEPTLRGPGWLEQQWAETASRLGSSWPGRSSTG